MAQLLNDAGYHTGLFGKWGLAEAGTSGIPNLQGFDAFYGFLDQRKAHHYYVDSLWHNEKEIAVPLSEGKQYSSADWYFDKAQDFIREKATADAPFFAYIPTQLPHLYMPYEPAEMYKDKPWPIGDKRWATMMLVENQHLTKEEVDKMDETFPQILQMDVDFLIYYYYGFYDEDPEYKMAVIRKYLPNFKRQGFESND